MHVAVSLLDMRKHIVTFVVFCLSTPKFNFCMGLAYLGCGIHILLFVHSYLVVVHLPCIAHCVEQL